MNRFRDPTLVPPGQEYFFQADPEGPVFRDPSMSGLLARLPGVTAAEVENFMCDYMPEGICRKTGRFPRMQLSRVVEFTKFLGRTAAAAANDRPVYVSPEEAERRQDICATCPMNVKSFCSSCLGLDMVFRTFLLPGHRTDRKDLGACYACGCLLNVKTHFQRDLLDSTLPSRPSYPQHCWMHDPNDS